MMRIISVHLAEHLHQSISGTLALTFPALQQMTVRHGVVTRLNMVITGCGRAIISTS
jgi:hypothetical protein